MCFVQMEPARLRDLSRFVGCETWKRLPIEQRIKLLKSIGLEHTDTIMAFKIIPTTFPAELAPNLSPEQRSAMFQQAKGLEVFASSTKGSYVVNDSKPAKVVVVDGKSASCNCKFEERRAIICAHLLAVNIQHPHHKIIETILIKRENESMAQRHTAAITATSGTKPGTSRRRAPPSTRNAKRPKITEIIDVEPITPNPPPVALPRLNVAGPRLPVGNVAGPRLPVGNIAGPRLLVGNIAGPRLPVGNIAGPRLPVGNIAGPRLPVGNRLPIIPDIHVMPPVSQYSSQRQRESRPIAVPQRPNTFHAPTAAALRNFKLAYNIDDGELWYNSNAFYLKEGKNVRDAYKRRCAHCNMTFKKNENPFVFTHLEKYEYTVLTTKETKIGYGERIICAKFGCFGTRYPYVTKECIIFETDELTSDLVIQRIFPQ